MKEIDKLLNREPWHKPLIRRFEHAMKRWSFGLVGAWLNPRRTSAPMSLDNINSVLILRYDALGDMVLSTPLIRILRSRKPSLIIGVAGSKINNDLIHADPDVDHVYTFIKDSTEGLWPEIKRAREIKWDLIINLVYNDKTRGALISRLINPDAIRATAVREPPEQYLKIYSIVAKRPELRPPTPMLEQFLLTLQEAIALDISPEEKHPSLKLDASVVFNVSKEVGERLGVAGAKRFICLNTNSSETFREWGYENAWKLSQQLTERFPDLLIIWTGAPAKKSMLKEFFASHQSARISNIDTPTPTHLAALIGEAALVISPDTSIVHIASAMRKPVVGLYMEANEFLPYGVPNIVLMPAIEHPLRTIAVKDVFDSASTLLSQTP